MSVNIHLEKVINQETSKLSIPNRNLKNCRMCNSPQLYSFLDLGFHPPSDEFRKKEELELPVTYYPLRVVICEGCGLVQLDYVVSPEILYQNDYPYESSTTKTGKEHFHTFAATVIEEFNLRPGDLAVDIGSNVGVLLEGFKIKGLNVLGIDPASNIVEIANKRGIDTICHFISVEAAEKCVQLKGKAKVVTGTNVFAHVDDLNHFMNAIKTLLEEDGLMIIEVPHLLTLLQNLEYDTIYHEHLSYISLEPLVPFFDKHGFEIIKVEKKEIHGGSLRIYVAGKGIYPVQESVGKMLAKERGSGLRDKRVLEGFATKVAKNRDDLRWLLAKLKHEGKRVVALSAPAKGMTLLNYARIGRETLEYITEKSSLKIGKFTPGDHIPVLTDEFLLKDQPDYALLLAWNFSKEIMHNLKQFKENGGKFIIPIPEPKII